MDTRWAGGKRIAGDQLAESNTTEARAADLHAGLEEKTESSSLIDPKVLEAIQNGIKEGDDESNELKMQGRPGELVAILSGNRYDLNDFKHNFAIYDNCCAEGVSSVKVFAINEDQPSSFTVDRYLSALGQAQGYGVSTDTFRKTCSELQKAANQGVPMPEEIKQAASPEDVGKLLHDKYAQLQIPANHVDAVSNKLTEQIIAYPETYGFASEPTRGEAELKAQQVVLPLGVSTGMLKDMIDQYKETRRSNRAK